MKKNKDYRHKERQEIKASVRRYLNSRENKAHAGPDAEQYDIETLRQTQYRGKHKA